MDSVSGYAELHALSNFSFLRGASHPAELVRQAHALGYDALALTDECSLAGVVRAHEALRELPSRPQPQSPFKLIVGSEFQLNGDLKLVLLAPNRAAYTQLCRLITLGRRRSPKGEYRLTYTDFASGLDDCLALWVLPHPASQTRAEWLRHCFPERAWLALELHRTADDVARLRAAQELSAASGLPLVAAGDVHMHSRARRMLQDALTAIRHGCTLDQAGERLYPNGERHLRSLTELRALYPAALLEESRAVAGRCNFSLAQLHYDYPPELVPPGCSASAHLRALTEQGVRERWPQGASGEVRELIDKELALIAELRYEHFFLTVHDVVQYARKQGILCQGRGSAANSAVCYALGITEIDPARTQLLFERFISRERNEPPDIDVDFEHDRREEVMQYIYGKYGRERAALAATVICYRTRSALRDLARSLGLDADAIGQVARQHMWWDRPGELPQLAARLRLPADRLRLLTQLVRELIGFPRHLSQHVGGFVIAGEPLCSLVPIENAAMAERTVIQWDKDDLESLGMLKVDVLALGMLSALRRCFELLERHRGVRLTMADIPPKDQATFDMICRAETVGVFQIESRAQMSMLPRLRPRSFYDLVIEVAIVRPGPIQGDMVHPYLKRREHPDDVQYPSPALESVLKRTLGVPIFQEQVMQIAMVAADFTPGEADGLRRAMAAWKRRGGLEPYRERLLTGMARNGYSPEFAEQIYRQILGFGDYGFPESHAASFALLTYVSSWLKCHEPAAFAAALINSQPMGFYAPAQLTQEARRSGVTVLPVDVTVSDWDCTLEPEPEPQPQPEPQLQGATRLALRLGLRLVRGLSSADGERLASARSAAPFASIGELARRAQLPQRSLQQLANAGALRALSTHRHDASWRALGVEQLPALLEELSAEEPSTILPIPTEPQEILADYRHLGLTTGRHPLELLRAGLIRRGFSSSLDLQRLADGSQVRVAGLVTHMQQPATASGVVFASLEDEGGILNIILWPKVFAAQRRCALESNLLMIEGQLQRHDRVAHVVAQRLQDGSGLLRSMTRRSRDFH